MNACAAFANGLNVTLGLVYPEACQVCGEERATPAAGFVGPRCRSQVKFIQRRSARGADSRSKAR